MAKVIDITPRLKTVAETETLSQPKTSQPSTTSLKKQKATRNLSLIESNSKITPILLHERRQVDRTLLSELISGMIVVPEQGLLKVSLFDISEEGLSFVTDPMVGYFKAGDEVALRVYLNNKTYFPLIVKIKHVTRDEDTLEMRHGVEYVKGVTNDVALQHFVNFIISISEGLQVDKGDLMIGRPVS